jgi:hypothetical protein
LFTLPARDQQHRPDGFGKDLEKSGFPGSLNCHILFKIGEAFIPLPKSDDGENNFDRKKAWKTIDNPPIGCKLK